MRSMRRTLNEILVKDTGINGSSNGEANCNGKSSRLSVCSGSPEVLASWTFLVKRVI